MDTQPHDALDSNPPPGIPQLLSSKFSRKTKFQKDEVAKKLMEIYTGETSREPNRTGESLTANSVPSPLVSVQTASVQYPNSACLPPKSSPKNADEMPREIIVQPATPAAHVLKGSNSHTVLDLNTSNSPSMTQTKIANSSSSPTPSVTHQPALASSARTPFPRRYLPPKVPPSNSEPRSHPVSYEELDHAKNLVLDLLGWGVDPEYLIQSGVSAEVVFRVFTDLNLRLPQNLVVSEELKGVAYSWGPRPG